MDAYSDGMITWTLRLTPEQVRRIDELKGRLEQQRGEPVARGVVVRSALDHGLAVMDTSGGRQGVVGG